MERRVEVTVATQRSEKTFWGFVVEKVMVWRYREESGSTGDHLNMNAIQMNRKLIE